MSEYNKLAKKFARDVKELQKNCSHEELSDGEFCAWGIGADPDLAYVARYCKRCMAVVETRRKREQNE